MLDKNQITLLTSPIPKEATKPVKARGITLTAIDNYYVIERLNEVFGIGCWSWGVEVVETTDFNVVVEGTITLPNGTKISQYGSAKHSVKNNDYSNTNPLEVDRGDLYKGAATAALSKVSSYLGIGNEIYGMKYKSKTTTTQTRSTSQTSSTGKKKESRPKVNIDDSYDPERVGKLVEIVKKENNGKAILYGRDKNTFYTNDYIYVLCDNHIQNVIEYYGATISG